MDWSHAYCYCDPVVPSLVRTIDLDHDLAGHPGRSWQETLMERVSSLCESGHWSSSRAG